MNCRARLWISVAILWLGASGCASGGATDSPPASPGTPTAVINLPPGALDTSTPTITPTPTASDTPTPTFTPTPPCAPKAQFVVDVTFPDGTPLSPGSRVTKIWRVKNTGSCAWDGNHRLVQTPGGGLKADTPDTPLPPVAPGDSVDISLTIALAADAPIGEARSAEFELRDPKGARFARLTMKVIVAEGTPSAPVEPTLSFGVGSISGAVWNDVCHASGAGGGPSVGNCVSNAGGGQQADGVKQSNEQGIGGIVVNLSAGSCPGSVVVASKITDAKGRYLFTDIGPGSYCVWVDSLDLTNGPILIPGAWSDIAGVVTDNGGKAQATVIVASGEQGSVIDFGWDYQLD